jgi:tetratricopeptide (TPR) repeat protein
MEQVRIFKRCLLYACLVTLAVTASAESTPPQARLTPAAIIERLAAASEPLGLELFTEGALLLSGAETEELPALKREIGNLIAEARSELNGINDRKELAEELLLYLHRRLLMTYRERQTRVDVLLREGSYNCVSSAVIYAVMAKAFSLQVEGVRTPDHAFCRVLIDGRAGEAVDVETTSPFGFDPGSRREFKDHFGRVTGYTYVPPQNTAGRRRAGEKELLALILYNRSAFASETGGYARALSPAVDAYALLADGESRERLLVAISNLASFYGIERRYDEGTSFLRAALASYGPEPSLSRLQADLLHNWAVELIDAGDYAGARSLLDRALSASELSEPAWRLLAVYALQKQAREASRRDYWQAAEVIRKGLERVGRVDELLQSYEAYAHNQAAVLIRRGDLAEARRVLSEALTVMPESRRLQSDVARLEELPEPG